MYVPNLTSVIPFFPGNSSLPTLEIDAINTHSVEELQCYSPAELQAWARLTDSNGKTLLALAVEAHNSLSNDKLNLINFILNDCKANPNQGDNQNWTPLYRASTGTKQPVIELLIKFNADVNVQNQDGSTPLHRLADRGDIKGINALLSHQDINVNIFNSLGTPLAYAAKNGNIEVATALINAHANINFVNDPLAFTPLGFAKIYEKSEIEQLLISLGGLEIAPVGSYTFSAISQLVQEGDQQAILESFKKREVDDYGRNVAHYCAVHGKIELLKTMQTQVKTLDFEDNQKRTPLHYAVIKGALEVAKYLIDTKSALDSQDKQGYGPLMWACQYGRNEIAKLLFAKAKDEGTLEKILNIQDNFGWKALHKAAETNNLELFKRFVEEFKMDPMQLTSPPDSKSPLVIAERTKAAGVISYINEITKEVSGIKV